MALVYSEWACPLLDTIKADIANASLLASSLLTPIVYGADLFDDEAKFLTGNFGFDRYMGVPRLMGANGWGMEDCYGGGDRDYDDLIVRFSLGV